MRRGPCSSFPRRGESGRLARQQGGEAQFDAIAVGVGAMQLTDVLIVFQQLPAPGNNHEAHQV